MSEGVLEVSARRKNCGFGYRVRMSSSGKMKQHKMNKEIMDASVEKIILSDRDRGDKVKVSR